MIFDVQYFLAIIYYIYYFFSFMKQPVKKLFDTPEIQLINQGKKIYNTKWSELISILSDDQEWIYDKFIIDKILLDRITTWASNISQLPSENEDILPIYAFFQKYAKNIIRLLKDTDIQNVDVSKKNRKENFLNECNSKIFNQSVTEYVKYAMYEFYKINSWMIQFKWPFIEIANAAGILYFLDRYWIDKTLLNKTEEEIKKLREKKMKAWWIVFPVDGNSDPKETAEKLIKHIKNRKEYENPN